MNQSKKSMLAILATLPLASIALAQTPPPAGAPETVPADLSPLDSDKDGRISKDEAALEPPLAQVFSKVDKNADGFIDTEEAKVIRVPVNNAPGS